MADPDQSSTADDDRQTFEADRRRRIHRNRLVGYALCIALWLLCALPLARLSSDEGGGTGVAAAYLAAGLGIAAVTRGIYARLRNRRFWSPWLFVTAAALALMSFAITSAGEKSASPRFEGGLAGRAEPHTGTP